MAVALVTATNAISSAANGIASLLVDATARVSSNVNCLVAVAHTNTTATQARWDVCAANSTMTTAGEIGGGANAGLILKVFYLMNPAGGEHILRVNVSGSSQIKTLGTYSLSGVADAGSIGSFLALSGTTDDLSAQVASTANEMVIDGNNWSGVGPVSALAVLSAGTDQTEKYDRRPNANITTEHAGSIQTGETSTRMSWGENFGTGCNWRHAAFNVVATGAAAPPAGGRVRRLAIVGAGS